MAGFFGSRVKKKAWGKVREKSELAAGREELMKRPRRSVKSWAVAIR